MALLQYLDFNALHRRSGVLFVCLCVCLVVVVVLGGRKEKFLGWEGTFATTSISRILGVRLMEFYSEVVEEYPLHSLFNRSLVPSMDGSPWEP